MPSFFGKKASTGFFYRPNIRLLWAPITFRRIWLFLFWILLVEGTGHFWNSLLLVCLALIIPRFTLFWLTTVFRPKNAFICLCQRSLIMPACAVLRHIHRLGEWETCQKTLIWIQFFFLVLQPKNHHFYSCASVDGSTLAKKDYAGTGI